MKEIRVEDLDPETAFKLKLEIALLQNASKIKENSKHPERFDEYISSRIDKICEILQLKGNFSVSENGKVIFTK
ncbi:MAG: hypothetical protein ACP5UV_03605 [Thermoplasmata archaeon]